MRTPSEDPMHANILRCLRRVHAGISGTLSYKDVYGHQDKHKTWTQMSLLERLNSKCGTLAKAAVSRGILECPSEIGKIRQSHFPRGETSQ